jgi:CRISPR-associated protein Csd2
MLGVAPNGTGVSEADLKLFWSALVSMFENDRSAARGYMEMRGIYVFAHQNKLGNASSGEFFTRLSVSSTRPAPREYSHYDVSIEGASLPEGVELVKLVG